MHRIYVAGPLFCSSERIFNDGLNEFLLKHGYSTFLPQKDGMELSRLLDHGSDEFNAMQKIFRLDFEEIRKADIVIFVMDGRVPDEGACVEIGLAYSLGKECIGLKTDSRSFISGNDNPMIMGVLKNRIAKDFQELLTILININCAYCSVERAEETFVSLN